MRDPVDNRTGTLPVTTNSALRVRFQGPDRIHTLWLTQDLLQQWVLYQSWGGSYKSCGGPKPRWYDTHEQGLADFVAMTDKFERQGWIRLDD